VVTFIPLSTQHWSGGWAASAPGPL